MSVKVSSWVWHEAPQDISGNELILLLALADVADDNGRCRYVDDETGLTYSALAEKVRVDRRTIERLIPKLRDRGVVEHTRGVKGRPNEFSVLVPWARTSADSLSGKGAQQVSDSPTTTSDSPTPVQDSPTAVHGFPDTAGDRSSINVLNVTDVVDVGAAKRGTRIPQPFVVTPEMVSWAREHAPLVDGPRSTQRFENHWLSKPGRDAVKLDWVRTWRNWLLKDQEDLERRQGGKKSPTDRALATIALGADDQRAVSA